MNRKLSLLLGVGLGFSGCATGSIAESSSPTVSDSSSDEIAAAPSGPIKTDAAITTALVDVIEAKNRYRLDLLAAEGTPLGQILRLGSPIGYSLRNRYLNIGVPVAEALSRNADPIFREKLVTLARWDSNAETRSAALIALAQKHDINDFRIFNEALVHLNAAVRFGALEALIVWGHPQRSLPLLAAASEKDYEPILRVYAAAGLARLGDAPGLHRLRAFLEDPSWLVRAMAARYLGDYGTGEDYDLLVSRIGRETTNDFVVAEYCIAALKLFPQKKP